MSDLTLDPDVLRRWIGNQQETIDTIDGQRACFMQATLDRDQTLANGEVLPHCWHWLYFLEARKLSELGRDGHPAVGEFLPPVALPRRMWAGSRLRFHRPLRVGESIVRKSSIGDVQLKRGKSGDLCFVTVHHSYHDAGELLVEEEHDIVYREDPAPGQPTPAPKSAPSEDDCSQAVSPSAVMLYRYSALTFNGHRIHYDIDYCRDVEGYPGLVFHGPLTATLLIDLASAHYGAGKIEMFSFRALSPLYGHADFSVHLKEQEGGAALWARGPDGELAVSGEVSLNGGSGDRF